MQRSECNGWLVYEWGETLRVAFIPSPWSEELTLVLYQPVLAEREGVYASMLLPVAGEVSPEFLQAGLGVTNRRAMGLFAAYQDALAYFLEGTEGDEAEAGEASQGNKGVSKPLRTIIPIQPI